MNTTYFRALSKVIIIIFFISFVPARLSAAKIAAGSYTGNGGTAQNITGLGFTPVMVLVQKVGSATSFIATSTMSGQTKVNATGALVSNYITAMASGQFTIGTNSADANTAATTYYYVAFAASAVSVECLYGNRFYTNCYRRLQPIYGVGNSIFIYLAKLLSNEHEREYF